MGQAETKVPRCARDDNTFLLVGLLVREGLDDFWRHG
jgi:hypothetical protein